MLNLVFKLKRRIQESLKYRLFYGYCNLLYRFKTIYPPKIDWKPLDTSLPIFVSIAREADVPLLAYSLKSLMQYANKSPQLWLIGDSDAAYNKLKEWIPDAPQGVELWHWETLLEKLDSNYQIFIKTWVSSGKWGGYAKKFAITLAANLHANIMLFDADVLWFGDFPSLLKSILLDKSIILASKDVSQAYDKEVANILDKRILTQQPLNCGVMYYPCGILQKTLSSNELISLLPHVKQATTHLEQTLIAYAFWQSQGTFFSTDIVLTTLEDDFKLTNKFVSTIRHYASVKHLFWRDA